MLANRTCRIEEQGGPDCENAREETKNYSNWRYELRNSSSETVILSVLSVDDPGWNKNGVLVTVLSKDAGVGYHHFDQLRGRINYEGV